MWKILLDLLVFIGSFYVAFNYIYGTWNNQKSYVDPPDTFLMAGAYFIKNYFGQNVLKICNYLFGLCLVSFAFRYIFHNVKTWTLLE